MYLSMENLQNKPKTQPENKYPADSFSTFCFEWLESVIQAIIVVVLLMVFVFRVVNVSGTSMLNTLHNGDKVVVLRWNYTPKNGDVVVIKRGQNLDEPLIKRVIATQGQKFSIDFSDGSVYVNGKKLKEPYIKEKMHLQGDADIPNEISMGRSFVMGDNRNHSLDSRFQSVGEIEDNNIVGKAVFIVFPIDRIGFIK